MVFEVKVPQLPESISDATVSAWHKKEGDKISRDENIVDLETDKVMLEVPSPTDGILKKIVKQSGSTVKAHDVIAIIEPIEASEHKEAKKEKAEKSEKKEEKKAEASAEKEGTQAPSAAATLAQANASMGPSVRRAVAQQGGDGSSSFQQASKEEATQKTSAPTMPSLGTSAAISMPVGTRTEKRVPMTRIRARIAERLLEVKQNTAMLTTFNEINMAPVMDIRHRYRDKFEKKYQVRLGFMSFFVRACMEALKQFPVVNASIDENDIVYHGYFDIGVAVSTDRGLIVPVLRDVDKMSMAEIEAKIAESAEKARTGKLTLEEMQGGTFTITNGGVFGSLMATPIINSPQCAILGMHKIQERPVVENGQIVIRPMMYVALSYDHRLIDGKESVTFLVTVKELLEDPTRLILEV